MGNKKTYKIINSLQTMVDIHLEKIRLELKKDFPNYGDVHHWESEINAWESRIAKLLKRLGK